MKGNRLRTSTSSDGSTYAFDRSRGVWVSYDDIRSIAKKTKRVLNGGYRGVSIWTLDFDDFTNACHNGAFPLLNTVKKVLAGDSGAPIQDSSRPSAPVTTTQAPIDIESNTEPWDDGSAGASQ